MDTNAKSNTDEAPLDLLSDCRVMLRFALKEGLVLSDELRESIGELDRFLAMHGEKPISAIPIKLIETDQSARGTPAKIEGGATPTLSLGALVLKIHAGLCRIVAPATALTLQASEPPPGKRHFLGGMPTLVKAAAVTATICALGFVATSILPAAKEAAKSANPTPTNIPTAPSSPAPTVNP